MGKGVIEKRRDWKGSDVKGSDRRGERWEKE